MACLQTINDSTFSQFFSSSGFFWSIFSIDLEIIAFFFQSDFFSARLGIALEVGKAKEETHSESREAKKKCAVFSTSKGIFDEKQSKTKTHKISKKEKKDLHIV